MKVGENVKLVVDVLSLSLSYKPEIFNHKTMNDDVISTSTTQLKKIDMTKALGSC
jgi:hypothetical protein